MKYVMALQSAQRITRLELLDANTALVCRQIICVVPIWVGACKMYTVMFIVDWVILFSVVFRGALHPPHLLLHCWMCISVAPLTLTFWVACSSPIQLCLDSAKTV